MSIESALRAWEANASSAETLAITYDDRHGLWGGLCLTIFGDGRVEQEAVQLNVPAAHAVTRTQISELIALLLELRAWEQSEPERAPNPDESQARLQIRVDKESSTTWEWFNDLKRNARIGRVIGRMKRLAWE